jgi:predicted ester cyclase
MHASLPMNSSDVAITGPDLSTIYLGFIACLNRHDWRSLHHFVADDVRYNNKPLRLAGYLRMLQAYCDEIPDLYFEIGTLVSSPPLVASRLVFNCTPRDTFLGLPVRGKRIVFSENAFYLFNGEQIQQIWSITDKLAIEAQL